MAIIKNEQGKLPYGRYTKKSNIIANISSVMCGFLIVILFVLIHKITNNLVMSFLVAFSFFLVSTFVISVLANLASKVLVDFYKDLDFRKLEKSYQKILKENLHSESRNVILIDFANILLNYDKERALLMWKSTKEPSFNKHIYHALKINFLIAEEKYDEAASLIESYRELYKGKVHMNIANNLELGLKIVSSLEIIEDIEKHILLPKNNRFVKITNCANLMRYFYSRNMVEHAIVYANIIKKENAGCTEIDKLVCEVLKEE